MQKNRIPAVKVIDTNKTVGMGAVHQSPAVKQHLNKSVSASTSKRPEIKMNNSRSGMGAVHQSPAVKSHLTKHTT